MAAMTKRAKKVKTDWMIQMGRRDIGKPGADPEETPTAEVLQRERGPAIAVLSSRVEPPVKRNFLKF
jgi:hypothetical protein